MVYYKMFILLAEMNEFKHIYELIIAALLYPTHIYRITIKSMYKNISYIALEGYDVMTVVEVSIHCMFDFVQMRTSSQFDLNMAV